MCGLISLLLLPFADMCLRKVDLQEEHGDCYSRQTRLPAVRFCNGNLLKQSIGPSGLPVVLGEYVIVHYNALVELGVLTLMTMK